jgi:branched-subunit amino acid aminotransferase/4-amino-4-deoxychorismate lyase
MTRQLILRLARALEISFSGAHVKIDELASSSEVILVGTASEVLPVVRIDDRTIGDGRPGPVACRLGDAYRQEVERWLARQPQST